MRECLTVQEAAADLLSRPRINALVAQLIDKDCTMSDLVACSEMSYSLLSHHMRRLIDLDLVHVVGQVPRAGRASPLYRATARSFFIPAALCRALPGEQLARDLRVALERARRPKGLLLWSEGGARMRLVSGEPRPDATELWMHIRLSPASARQLNQELRDFFERWRTQESDKGAQYLVHGACARQL